MRALEPKPRFVVMGGAGAMGRITVRDLVETAPPDAGIVIADFNKAAAQKLAKSYGSPRVRAAYVDVSQVAATARTLKGSFVVLSAVQHQLNIPVMQACLRAGCHYVDLGGLFHVTRQQLKLHSQFKKKGLLAVLGMGAAPGIVNVLARKGADTLDTVRSIDIFVGGVDRTPGRTSALLGTSYSLKTILEEASSPAAVFRDGKWHFVPAMSGEQEVRFPAPVGLKRPAYTLHSEVATLPLSFKNKGVREVSFRIAFDDTLRERLLFLRELGMLSTKPLKLAKSQVIPQDLLLNMAAALPPGTPGGAPDEYEVLRVVVCGQRSGEDIEVTLDAHTPGIPAWGLGIDVDTGCPPSIVGQMLWRGDITARGTLPAEIAVPVEPFLLELQKRAITVRTTEKRGGARV